LRDEFQETVNLGVLDATRIVYLEIVESRRSMRFVAERGHREHVQSTALGKAICTELEDSEILTILESEGMPALTDKTITDPELFVKTVDGIRHDGYAIDDGENEPAGRCVAVPIAGVSPRAAISLSAPAARFSIEDAREAASALARVAAEISAELS
jgi:IclR family acetate operon transcriptional repressor